MQSSRPLDAVIDLELDKLCKKIILMNSEEAATESQIKNAFNDAYKKVIIALAIP